MAINAKLQTLINIKNDIGTAITNKGGTITGATPFFNYASEINNISTGTPQTVFQDSTGAKWARTNAVNLTNVSNNVTSDFNWWQPANNTTSDAILNVGTVGANISGNIRLVPVNQVNIAQYENIIATDTLGGKYVGYNGYDFNTNPTPTGNTTFNRWLLNNSATGTVIFANATFTTGTYNGPNATFNESNIAFIGNTVSYGGVIESIAINNGFIYVGGANGPNATTQANSNIRKYYESNLVFAGATAGYGGQIRSVTINNGFIYAGGTTDASFVNGSVKKYHESNLVFVGATANYGGFINSVTINNGFVYAVGGGDNQVRKYYESNLAFVGNTASYGGFIYSATTNNGFIYVGGQNSSGTDRTVKKFYESNLAFVNNTASSYNAFISSITINNGFIYVGGSIGDFGFESDIKKYHESNLVFVGNFFINRRTYTVTTNNGFLYVGGEAQTGVNRGVMKFYESNLAFVANTVNYGFPGSGNTIYSVKTNNGFIYAGGANNQTVYKFQERQTIPDNQTFYTAAKIKE
jgi:hypothetical protein